MFVAYTVYLTEAYMMCLVKLYITRRVYDHIRRYAIYYSFWKVSTLNSYSLISAFLLLKLPKAILFAGPCEAMTLSISRDASDADFDDIVHALVDNDMAKAVVMFVNEDNCKRLLQAVIRHNQTDNLWFLASDSWGAKIHPVTGQEAAATDAVTILPKRHVIEGNYMHVT